MIAILVLADNVDHCHDYISANKKDGRDFSYNIEMAETGLC